MNDFNNLSDEDAEYVLNLPCHLAQAKMGDDLYVILSEFDFLQYKVDFSEVQLLIEDYTFGLHSNIQFPDNQKEVLELIQDAIRLSEHIIKEDKKQFPGQLIGRLKFFDLKNIKILIKQIENWQNHIWICPLTYGLIPPGGVLVKSLNHPYDVTRVISVPHKQRILSTSDQGTIKFWDIDKAKEIHTIEAYNNRINAVALTSDGNLAITTLGDGIIKAWDIKNARQLFSFSVESISITDLAFIPNTYHLISISGHESLKIWNIDIKNNQVVLIDDYPYLEKVTITNDGKYVVFFLESTLIIWNIKTNAKFYLNEYYPEKFKALAITSDETKLLSASSKDLIMWDIEKGKKESTFQHTSWINAVVITPDGEKAISALEDSTLKVWDLNNKTEIMTLQGHTERVRALTLMPDGQHIISGSEDGTIKIWDLQRKPMLAPFIGHSSWVKALAITPDNLFAVSASEDGTLKTWNLKDKTEVFNLKGHTKWIDKLAITPDGKIAISASGDCTLKVWDLATGKELHNLVGHTDWIWDIAITQDSKRVISASRDCTLRIWNIKNGIEEQILQGHSKEVLTVTITPDEQKVISGSGDETIKVWDFNTGKELSTLRGHNAGFGGVAGVWTLAVTPDGKRVVSGSDDQTLRVWNLESNSEPVVLRGHTDRVWMLAIIQNGEGVISASDDGTLKIWNLETARELHTLQNHTRWMWSVAITSDGQRAISTSDDQTLKVWDIKTGKLIASFKADVQIRACAIGSDRVTIVVGELSGRVHFLRLEDMEYSKSDRIIQPHD